MKRTIVFLLAMMFFGSAAASESKVVVSINPIHSLVASVMEGIGTPDLIVQGFESLHGYQVKPSDAELLENSDVIVWLGPTMESTLIASISNAPEGTTVIEVGKIHGLQLYENREDPDGEHGHDDEHDEGMEAEHGHDDEHDEGMEAEHGHGEEEEHGHDDEHDKDMVAEHGHDDEHGHGEEDEHGHDDEHDKGMEAEHGHDDEHGHGEMDEHGHVHGRYDLHIWLDVDNAKVVTREVAEQLAVVYPQHEAQLAANVSNAIERLDSLEVELRGLSESFSNKPFVVFHDAYQYLEKMLGLNNVGTVTVNPELGTGAKRLYELRETISRTGASCIFKEPQFDPSALEVVSEGTDLKIGTLDPLGAEIAPGPDAYYALLRNMVNSLKDCLG